MESKSLEDLRNDYLKEIKQLDEKIEKYRLRLRKAQKNRNADEIFTVQRLLAVFYNERVELVYAEQELRKYCEEE